LFKATGLGILLLLISACTQATQHVLEERIYRMDPNLSALNMAVMEVLWKNLLVWSTIPIFSKIPVPTNMCSSGVIENNLDAIYEVVHNNKLIHLFVWGVLTFVLT